MKKSYILYSLIFFAHSFIFTSCSDEDSNGSEQEKPVPEETVSDIDPAYYLQHIKDLLLVGDENSEFDPSAYKNREITAKEKVVIDGINNFSIRMFKKNEFILDSNKENTLMSPFSIQQVLAMLMNGANDATLEELFEALEYDGSLNDYNDANRVLTNRLKLLNKLDGKTDVFDIANATWIDYSLPVFRSFKSNISNYLDAEIYAIDTQSDNAGKIINSWCNDKTRGLIPNIVNDGALPFRLMIANAVYFNDSWNVKFDKTLTEKKPFYNVNGTVSNVDMMRWDNPKTIVKYASLDKADVASIPFEGYYRMMVILPHKNCDINECISEMDENAWKSILSSIRTEKTDIMLPKFKVTKNIDLIGLLKSFGVKSLFNNNSSLSKLSSTPINIGKIAQKTIIEVDEDGVEAAAVTFASDISTGEKTKEYNEIKYFHADRPFIYAIYDEVTSTIIFVGSVKIL